MPISRSCAIFKAHASNLSRSMQCILSKEPDSLSRESTSSEIALLTSSTLLLIDLDMVDQPVDILKGFWVLGDELIAGCRHFAALVLPNVTGPVATKCVVDDNLVVLEMAVDVAFPSERGGRSSPGLWVWLASSEISGNLVPREEIDVDILARPVHSINTASNTIKASAIVGGIFGVLATSDEASLLVAVLELHDGGW